MRTDRELAGVRVEADVHRVLEVARRRDDRLLVILLQLVDLPWKTRPRGSVCM